MRLLHVEDDPFDSELLQRLITTEWPDCVITSVATHGAFVTELERRAYDVIVSDFALPGFDGFGVLALARQAMPETPVIIVSGNMSEERAIEAVRRGANDYVMKDRPKRLVTAITRALRDVTERRQRRAAEGRIRELADCLNQAREAIFIIDFTDRVSYWNAGAERIFGWSAADAIGQPLSALAPAVLAGIRAAQQQIITTGEACGELHVTNRAGEALILEARQSLIRDERGQPKARLCITTDVSERKKLEEQFLRAQRMENLGLLAAGIAHDLNNTLAPILLATPMLRDQVADAGAVKLVDTLEKSAERGSQLVQQILAFAHGVGGEHQLLQVKHLLRDIAAVISGSFPKSITLRDEIPSDLWPIKANATHVHQVVLNLCVNARDAMPEGGTLSVRGRNVQLSAAAAAVIPGGRPGAFLLLEVQDTGTGIPPEIIKRIWEPFFTTKEAGRGTGLGLSTVRGIIEAHAGFVDVQSTPGAGALFRVYLPAAEVRMPDAAELAARAQPRGAGELILVVDDEEHIRDMTTTILGRNGYRVITACDGEDATRQFAEHAREIRLVISDLHMPNLDGAMLARALRDRHPPAKMLVMSGMASGLDNGIEFRAEEFADGLLLKPFRSEALLEKVHALLHAPDAAPASTP